jgi:tetratricopeptide (TPR) repeat protein
MADDVANALQRRVSLAMLPLILVWGAAAAPFVLFVVHRSDPEAAVRIAVAAKFWGQRALLVLAVLGAVAALLFPPLPAWLRLMFARTKVAWSIDRAPLLNAMAELRHLETAQRHYEVGRLAWLRRDLGIAGPHLQRALELDASLAPAQHLFGLYLLRVGALPPAHAAFTAAETLDPGHAFGDALLYRGRCEDLLGAHERAVATFAAHQQQHGGGRKSRYWYGDALWHHGERDAAGTAFREAAAPAAGRLTAEENWFRALARVRCWRLGGAVRPAREGGAA